jgi:hypothetical protein
MPPAAIALLLVFTVAALVAGAGATWVVGPRRAAATVIPTLAAFLALWVVGHRSGLAVGPTVMLFGFEVNLAFDLAVAILAAAIAAIAQCLVAGSWRRRSLTK